MHPANADADQPRAGLPAPAATRWPVPAGPAAGRPGTPDPPHPRRRTGRPQPLVLITNWPSSENSGASTSQRRIVMRRYNKLAIVGYDPEGHEPCQSCLKDGKEVVVIEHDVSRLTL